MRRAVVLMSEGLRRGFRENSCQRGIEDGAILVVGIRVLVLWGGKLGVVGKGGSWWFVEWIYETTERRAETALALALKAAIIWGRVLID